MKPATRPRDARETRLLVVDPETRTLADRAIGDLPTYFGEGDLLVVNDAATLPASLHGTLGDAAIEARLVAFDPLEGTANLVLFGAGDYRTRTEHRAPPPSVRVGARLVFGSLAAEVRAIDALSPRLLAVAFDRREDALMHALYEVARPIQYAHVPEPLALWSVQTPFGARPWAVEMPSAGRPLAAETLLALLARGARLATITHAAGLSATGDPAIDRALPLPERFDIPEATVEAIARAERVIAVGTSVVRALEGSVALFGAVRATSAVTDLRIDARTDLHVVDGLLTGMHDPGTSHWDLLGAFVPSSLLAAADAHASSAGYLGHELGDETLVLPCHVRARHIQRVQ